MLAGSLRLTEIVAAQDRAVAFILLQPLGLS